MSLIIELKNNFIGVDGNQKHQNKAQQNSRILNDNILYFNSERKHFLAMFNVRMFAHFTLNIFFFYFKRHAAQLGHLK